MIAELQQERKSNKEERERVAKLVSESRKSYFTKKKEFEKFVEDRTNTNGSMDTKFENLLCSKFKVPIQPYQGGQIQGVGILKLFEDIPQLFCEIKKICCEQIAATETYKRENNLDFSIPSVEECKKVLYDHKKLLVTQNMVYGILRKIGPTDKDIEKLKNLVAEMKEQWKKMCFSMTPKSHYIFEHAVWQIILIGGFGDKPDDILELIHQWQDEMNKAMKRVNNIKQQMQLQARQYWLMNDPAVIQHCREVNLPYKKKPKANDDESRVESVCLGRNGTEKRKTSSRTDSKHGHQKKRRRKRENLYKKMCESTNEESE